MEYKKRAEKALVKIYNNSHRAFACALILLISASASANLEKTTTRKYNN
jgi:hypothetical protein